MLLVKKDRGGERVKRGTGTWASRVASRKIHKVISSSFGGTYEGSQIEAKKGDWGEENIDDGEKIEIRRRENRLREVP